MSLGFNFSFQIRPLGTVEQKSNIIIFKSADDSVLHRVSFVKDSTTLKFSRKVESMLPIEVINDKPLPLFVYSSIKIVQKLNERGLFHYQAFINDSLVVSKDNHYPMQYENVSVYTSSPNIMASNVFIRDLQYENIKESG